MTTVVDWRSMASRHLTMLLENLSLGCGTMLDSNRPGQLKWLASLAILGSANILSKQRTMMALIRLRGWAGWSASLLFAYATNRFSHDVAQFLMMKSQWMHAATREFKGFIVIKYLTVSNEENLHTIGITTALRDFLEAHVAHNYFRLGE